MKEINKENLIQVAKELATPIDFDLLILEGIIIKRGTWYEVIDDERLPQHVHRQISQIKNDKDGKFLVKLPQSWKKSQ